jgi:hypothetical protein
MVDEDCDTLLSDACQRQVATQHLETPVRPLTLDHSPNLLSALATDTQENYTNSTGLHALSISTLGLATTIA